MNIIYLNGASCSGKSSLASALQQQLSGYYLHIGIDSFMTMMPSKANNWHESKPSDGFSYYETLLPTGYKEKRIQSGEYGKKINSAFHLTVHTLLSAGHNLIIDDVADGINEVAIWIEEFHKHNTLLVAVKCSPALLELREAKREDRLKGSAVEQHYHVHQGVDYHLSVHTDQYSSEQCAQQVITYMKALALQ